MKKTYIDKTAIVEEGAEIGEGTKIWHFSHVMKGAKIGKNCVLGQNTFVGNRAVIGDRVKIQNNVSVYGLVTLEDDVFVGPSAVFTNDLNPRAPYPKHGDWVPTLVKKGASLGANSTIVCGITIGKWAFVAAGAVVTKNVPDYALVIGVPAKVSGWMCECGERLGFDTRDTGEGEIVVKICPKCGRKHEKIGMQVKQIGEK